MTTDDQLKDIYEYYKQLPNSTAQENIISMLREIQDILGCIPSGIADCAADEIGAKRSVVNQLIKLYPSLKAANYKHRIIICTGQRCSSKASSEICKAVKKELQPDENGISQDGTILLTTQNCLKHCTTASNMMIDGVIYPYLTAETALSLVRKLTVP